MVRLPGRRLELASIYRRRFRPEFMPEYHSAQQDRSVELHAAADEHYEHGTRAKVYADRYILATVFMAAVLFFAGISLRLDWQRLRIVVLGMACALLVGGAAFVLNLPLA